MSTQSHHRRNRTEVLPQTLSTSASSAGKLLSARLSPQAASRKAVPAVKVIPSFHQRYQAIRGRMMSNVRGEDGQKLVHLLSHTRDRSVYTKPRRRNLLQVAGENEDAKAHNLSSSPARPRRSPMFTFKLMKGISSVGSTSSNTSNNMNEVTQERQNEAMSQVRHVVKRAMVFKAHDRTSHAARSASAKACEELKKGAEEIEECNQSQISFYSTRRRIGQAAVEVARDHNIDLEFVDSDEEKLEGFQRSLSSAHSSHRDLLSSRFPDFKPSKVGIKVQRMVRTQVPQKHFIPPSAAQIISPTSGSVSPRNAQLLLPKLSSDL